MKMMVSFNIRKIYTLVLSVFLAVGTFFFLPLPNGTGMEQALEFGYLSQELFFRYGAILLFVLSMFIKPIRIMRPNWIIAFVLYAFITSLLFGFDVSIRRSLMNLGCAAILFKAIYENVETGNVKTIGIGFALVLVWNLITCVQQYYGIDPLFSAPAELGHQDRMVGFMRMKVHLGALVAFISPFIFALWWPLLILTFPLLFWSNSSVAIASFVISIGIILFYRIKRVFFITSLAALILAGGFYVLKFDMPGGQFGERLKVWNATYSLTLKSNPFWGNGIGSFSKINLQTKQATVAENLQWTWAHNEFIQAFFEFGFAGISLIFMYIKGCFKGFLAHKKDRIVQISFASLVSVLAIAFFHFPFHLGRLSGICVFIMAFFQARVNDLEG